MDDYDYCYECGGYGDDYHLDENGEWVSSCPGCPYNTLEGDYEDECRFQGCSHTHEPDCGVKKALEEGKISKIRYDNYVNIYTELKEKRKW